MKWNKCSDELPKSAIDVLVSDGEYVTVACNNTLGYWDPANVQTDPRHETLVITFNIKYWAELPELPEEDKA